MLGQLQEKSILTDLKKVFSGKSKQLPGGLDRNKGQAGESAFLELRFWGLVLVQRVGPK